MTMGRTEMPNNSHMHDNFEDAYRAVKRNLAAREAEARTAAEKDARAEERSPWTSNLLLEGDDDVEAPPRTGPRKGKERREYDRIRHNWKAQVQSKVVDEGDDAAEAPQDPHLHDAYRAVMSGDREAFSRAVQRAIDERIRDAIADLKLRIAMNMTAGIEDAEEEDD
jgi:hypothetical protein